MVMSRAFLFASLCISLTMGESVLVRSGYPRPFAAGQQGGKPSFQNAKAGDAREVGGVKLRWCPPGRFVMGSPPDEPERRSDEAQVEVRLTKGFWMGECEVTRRAVEAGGR